MNTGPEFFTDTRERASLILLGTSIEEIFLSLLVVCIRRQVNLGIFLFYLGLKFFIFKSIVFVNYGLEISSNFTQDVYVVVVYDH